jgi:hypothetical protein
LSNAKKRFLKVQPDKKLALSKIPKNKKNIAMPIRILMMLHNSNYKL